MMKRILVDFPSVGAAIMDAMTGPRPLHEMFVRKETDLSILLIEDEGLLSRTNCGKWYLKDSLRIVERLG